MKYTKTSTTLMVALVIATAQFAFAADSYKLDMAHSSIEFSVKHMMVSNVKGSFDKFDGTISFDPDNIANSSVQFSIDVASVNTKNEKRDEHLRSADFFDAANHPEITFTSEKISKKGDGYVATGTLVIHGVSKKVDLPFVLNGPVQSPWGQTVMGVEVNYQLNRKDYGLVWNKTMDNGGLVVGDDVKIEINLEASKS
jgi:polyisoprenoid-binding protein YceI